MKSLDFLKEGFMEDASEAHQDHEVQMARQECFHAAEHALALHKLLRNISEAQGLEGWVSSKITLANDYLKRVREYLEYELLTKDINDEAPTLTIAEDQESKKKNLVVEYKVSGAEPSSENYTINNIDLNALQNVTSRYYDRPVTIAQSKDNPDLYKINVAMTVGPVDYGSYNAATRTASVAKRMTDKGDQLQKVLQGISEAQSEEERAESERQMQDFLAKGGEIQQVRANRGPRRSGASLASHHIGGMGDARTGRRSQMRGLGSNPTGKLLVAKESEGVAEGIFDFKKQTMPEHGDELKIGDRHVMFDDGGSHYGVSWIKQDRSEAYEEFDKSEYTNLDQLKKAIWDEIKYQDQQSVAEGLPGGLSKSDYTPGATKKYISTNCTTCHGRQVMYKTPDGKLHADNKQGAKKISCPVCKGTGDKQGVAEGKKSDRYHIVGKDGKPVNLASYPDRDSAIKDRDEKYPGAVVQQVGPRGKVKGVAEGTEDMFAVPDRVESLVKQHGLYNEKGYLDLFAKLAGRPLSRAEIDPALGYASKLNRLLGNIRMRSEWRGTNPKQDQELIDFANQWMDLFNKSKNSFGDNHQQGVAEGAKCNHTMEGTQCPVHGLKECGSYGKVEEMSAGSVATVVNLPAKNKSKVGTLFGGTYKQKKVKEAKQMTFPGENTKPSQRPGDQVRGTEKATKPNPFKHRLVGNE